jgi:hypothetical protein
VLREPIGLGDAQRLREPGDVVLDLEAITCGLSELSGTGVVESDEGVRTGLGEVTQMRDLTYAAAEVQQDVRLPLGSTGTLGRPGRLGTGHLEAFAFDHRAVEGGTGEVGNRQGTRWRTSVRDPRGLPDVDIDIR